MIGHRMVSGFVFCIEMQGRDAETFISAQKYWKEGSIPLLRYAGVMFIGEHKEENGHIPTRRILGVLRSFERKRRGETHTHKGYATILCSFLYPQIKFAFAN